MKTISLLELALKRVLRHRVRSALTVAGVAAGMFLYGAVQTMQHSLQAATADSMSETTLVVFRDNRFCPSTSRLPEYYLDEIRRIDGVAEAIPVQVAVNNCGTSLDVISFRGVPADALSRFNPDLEVIAGSLEDWWAHSDGALIGENFAIRRGLRPGDSFEAVGVSVRVSAIIRSPVAQDNNVAFVHLPYLQQASRVGLGVVTQFNVRVTDAARMEEVARTIDALFASDAAPTSTRPEKAFFAQTARDLFGIISFTRWIGYGAVVAVLGLVANALLLAARGRVKEGAILQTVGFPRRAVALVMVCEGAWLGLVGGAVGSAGAAVFFNLQRFTFGTEGLTLALTASPLVVLQGMLIALMLGLVASVWPAILTSTRPVVESLHQS